jgi:hypothetical protein
MKHERLAEFRAKAREIFPGGADFNDLMQLTCYGFSKDEVLQALASSIDPPYRPPRAQMPPRAELQDQRPIAESGAPAPSESKYRLANKSQPRHDSLLPPESQEQINGAGFDKSGHFVPNLASALAILRSAPELSGCFAFDQMLNAPIVVRALPGHMSGSGKHPRPLSDDDVSQTQEWLQTFRAHEARQRNMPSSHRQTCVRMPGSSRPKIP